LREARVAGGRSSGDEMGLDVPRAARARRVTPQGPGAVLGESRLEAQGGGHVAVRGVAAPVVEGIVPPDAARHVAIAALEAVLPFFPGVVPEDVETRRRGVARAHRVRVRPVLGPT